MTAATRTALEIPDPEHPVILAAVPVLILAGNPSEQEGTVVNPSLGNSQGVRVLKEGDIIAAYGSLHDFQKREFVATAGVFDALRDYNRNCSSRRAQQKYRKAIGDYEALLASCPAPKVEESGGAVSSRDLGQALLSMFPGAAASPEEAVALFYGRAVSRNVKFDPRKGVCYVLSRGLNNLRLVLWESSRGILPGLLCSTPEAVLRAGLVLQMFPAAGAGWAVCAHPSCRKLFRWKGKPRRYCCREHGEAYRSACYRKTLKGRRATRRAAQKRRARQKLLLVPKRRVAGLGR